MARRHHRRHNYKFTEKKHSVIGIIASVLAAASLAVCAVLISVSFRQRGNADIYIGSVGMLGCFLSIAAIMVSWRAVKQQDTFRAIPYTAATLSVLSLVIWAAIYIGGVL